MERSVQPEDSFGVGLGGAPPGGVPPKLPQVPLRTDAPARIIEVLTPAGPERWFEETAALAPGDREGFAASCERHGIRWLPDSPWGDELRQRYDLV